MRLPNLLSPSSAVLLLLLGTTSAFTSTSDRASLPFFNRVHGTHYHHHRKGRLRFSKLRSNRVLSMIATEKEWSKPPSASQNAISREDTPCTITPGDDEDIVVRDAQRRDAITGSVALLGLLPLLKETGFISDSLTTETSSMATSLLPPDVLKGDTIVRSLWLSRLSYPVLIVSMEVGMFEALKSGPLNLERLGSRLEPNLRGKGRVLEALVNVLVSLELLQKTTGGNKVELTPAASQVLLKESPFFWGPQLLAADGITASLRLAVRRDDKVAARSYSGGTSGHSVSQVSSFIDSMQAHGSVTAIATAHALRDHIGPTSSQPALHLLDMAGGSGCFAKAIQDCCDIPQVTLGDLPPVVERFQKERNEGKYFGKGRHKKQLQAVPADLFVADTWPIDPDVHLLANVVHDWGRAQTLEILKASHHALTKSSSAKPGQGRGRLILIEQLLNDAEMTGPLNPSLASVSMLLGDWRTGKQYSFQELKSMMTIAGFQHVELGPSCGDFHTAVIGYV